MFKCAQGIVLLYRHQSVDLFVTLQSAVSLFITSYVVLMTTSGHFKCPLCKLTLGALFYIFPLFVLLLWKARDF